MRQMILVGFLQAQNCTNLACSWRHPKSRTDSWSPDYYRHIGRVLEEGKFHLGFFDDRLSMPDMYARDHAHTVRHGIRCVKLDAVTVLTVMGMATERLGLGATYSTSYYEPFHVARLFATLDLMTEGRAAWNVVTSLNDGEAQNMGRDEVIAHDLRYDRADEFMHVVLGHWDTWEDDAIVQDKATGIFALPEKVHRLDHKGRHFRSRGPFTVPRSPQGHPVIIQAGQSGRGKSFGAQWGEVIFVVYPSIDAGKRDYADFKGEVARRGREPEHVKITQLVNTVSAPTRAEAEDKWAEISRLPIEMDALLLLSTSTFQGRAWTRRSPTPRWRKSPASRASATASCAPAEKTIRRCATSSISAAAVACTTRSSAARARSPTGSSSGFPSVPATASSSPQPTFLEPTRISCGLSSLSCSAAVCFAASTRAGRYGKISGSRPRHRPPGASNNPIR